MKIQLLRHAATIIEFAGKKLLVDPMLSAAGTRSSISTKRKGKDLKNPLVDIPMGKAELERLISSVDAVLITHIHTDHFDDFKGDFLSKDIKIFCQPEDANAFKVAGFTDINQVSSTMKWNGIEIVRTKCHHGGILVRKIMGKGSGYFLKAFGEKTLYITGDTIWCGFVEDTIKEYSPDIIIIYGGGAKLPFGRSITMDEKDIEKVCEVSKEAQKVIVHMEAMNHCLLNRDKLKRYLKEKNCIDSVHIPRDGEVIDLGVR